MDALSYQLTGLTKLDKLQLKGVAGITFEEAEVPKSSHGEVVTLIAIIAPTAIAAIASFFLKKHNNEDFEEIIEEVYPDGKTVKRKIHYKKDSSEAPESELIKQIRGK